MQTQMLIAGKLVTGEGAAERVLDAGNGEQIAAVPEASVAQVQAAVMAAEAAFPGWARTPPKERATALLRIADHIEAEAAAYAALESRNTGKPLAAALSDELPSIADVFRFFAGACRSPAGLAAAEYLPGHTSMIRRDPVGVVGSIAPWNYPLMMAAWKIAPAIAAGNTLVLKPSELTPLTLLKLAAALAQILPAGVVNIVCGRGEPVGSTLISHERVRMVSLTGSVATGQKVLAAAAGNLKRTHLELGGKAPVIVFDDADIDAVIAGIRTFAFYNAGQDCTAACRMYAGRRVYERRGRGPDERGAYHQGRHAAGARAWRWGHSSRRRSASASPSMVARAAAADACRADHRRQGALGERVLLRADGDRRRAAGR